MTCQCVECVGYQKEPTDAEIIAALEANNAANENRIAELEAFITKTADHLEGVLLPEVRSLTAENEKLRLTLAKLREPT